MARRDWASLNGLWDYAITHRDAGGPEAYRGHILAPFPFESALSGVMHPLNEQQRLWYHRMFRVPAAWQGKRVWLHFEAVDWEARVWLNQKELGSHRGGYERFSFDITDALAAEGEQDLTVSVFDPSNHGSQPAGQQRLGPHAGFYSACSGIWQTVWLEPAPEDSIASLKLTPDIDMGLVEVVATCRGNPTGSTVEAIALDVGKPVGRVEGPPDLALKLPLAKARLWSPAKPFLYDLRVTLKRAGRPVDEVSSYFGMRGVSLTNDSAGVPRIMLNHEPFFGLGVLDQGYWPDGLYTAPSDGLEPAKMAVRIEPVPAWVGVPENLPALEPTLRAPVTGRRAQRSK
jgi:beta-galactosidase/beta-glucuronidase